MSTALQQRTLQLGWYATIALTVLGILGVTFSLLLRKEQMLKKALVTHRTIVANLPLMRRETLDISQQLSLFRQLMPTDQPQRSNELLLFTRLDQLKTALKPLEMSVTTPETKDGATSIVFSMRLPVQSYSAIVNSLGTLQSTSFPFVVVRSFSIDAKTNSQIAVEGSVIMPVIGEGK